MNQKLHSLFRLKPLVRTLALLAAWALITIIQPQGMATSHNSNTGNNLPLTSQIPGSVTPGDGSIPDLIPGPYACTNVWVGVTTVGYMGYFPWGPITLNVSNGMPAGTYQFWAEPGPSCGYVNIPYCTSPLSGSMTCVPTAPVGTECHGSFDIKLYAMYGNFSGTVYKLPQGTPVGFAGVNAGSLHTHTDENGYYSYKLTSTSIPLWLANNWGLLLGCQYSPFGLGTPFILTPSVGGVIGTSTRATGYPSKDVVVDLFILDPNMEEPSTRSCPVIDRPISIATGNMFLDQTDITIPTLGPDLEFVRSYNSQLAYRNISGVFGPGWSHAYEQSLSFPATGIIMLHQGDGVPTYFQDMDANLTYDASVPFNQDSWIEKQADGTYIRRLRKGGSETYDSAGRLTSMVDSFGNTTTLGRDGSGRLISINAPGSRSLTMTYNAANRIASLSGPAGLIATYTYDASSRLQKVTYADGRGYTFTYDSSRQLLTVSDLSGKVLETHTYSGNKAITSEISDGRGKYTMSYGPLTATVTDALGNVTTYDWTNIWGMKHVTKITGPCPSCGGIRDQTQQWTYDDKGRVLSNTDGNGNKTTYTYNANGDLISETDPDNNVITYTVGTDGRRTSTTVKSVVDPAQNKVTTFEYDRGNLKTQTEHGLLGDSSVYTYTTTYTYNANGKVLSVDGPRTDVPDVTTFGYNTLTGDLLTITQPFVGTTMYSNFTPLGQPQTVTDTNGVATTYQYDQWRRLLSAAIGGDTTSYAYTPSGKQGSVTLPRGNTTSYIYDTYDRLVTIRDPLGNSIKYTYDLMGQRTREELRPKEFPVFLPIILRSVTQAAGSGLVTLSQPPDGWAQKWQDFEYDGLSQLTKIINPDGSFTEYSYDEAGNRTSLTTPRGFTTTYQYDALNRLRVSVQPGPITTTYGYNVHNDLTSVTDPKGHVTTYVYDDMGRVYRENSPDTGTTTYTYDAAGNRVSMTDARGITIRYEYDALNRLTRIDFPTDTDIVYTYDTCLNGKGRLCQVVDQAGTTTYRYSVKGELQQESQTIAGVTYATNYGYDPNGNLISIMYPSGLTVSYTFDMADRVTSVSMTPVGGSAQSLVSNITYKPFGDVSSLTYGNALLRTVSYDHQYRITAIQSGGVQRLTYSHDPDGNVMAINNLNDATRNKTFTYDPLDRLQSATGPWGALAWTYDGVGNRLTQTDSNGTRNYSYQLGTNRLASVSGPAAVTFGYDPSGNTTSENARTYVYNQNGRLIRAAEG